MQFVFTHLLHFSPTLASSVNGVLSSSAPCYRTSQSVGLMAPSAFAKEMPEGAWFWREHVT